MTEATTNPLAVSLAVNTSKRQNPDERWPMQTCLNCGFFGEPAVGFEPTACCLRNSCSAPELRWRGGMTEAYMVHTQWALVATSRSVSYRGGARQARARSA